MPFIPTLPSLNVYPPEELEFRQDLFKFKAKSLRGYPFEGILQKVYGDQIYFIFTRGITPRKYTTYFLSDFEFESISPASLDDYFYYHTPNAKHFFDENKLVLLHSRIKSKSQFNYRNEIVKIENVSSDYIQLKTEKNKYLCLPISEIQNLIEIPVKKIPKINIFASVLGILGLGLFTRVSQKLFPVVKEPLQIQG